MIAMLTALNKTSVRPSFLLSLSYLHTPLEILFDDIRPHPRM